ncbi:DUF2634 domain-containing protein [Caproicibacterium sp. XB1]|uniref:DUF2634 domain-containing protein n=1 Tax=Caproicibacterium sp. XB1 TaxID=3396405 RepID=UPI0039B6EC16
MIPYEEGAVAPEFDDTPQPGKTYRLYPTEQAIAGTVDEVSALKQAVYLTLNIERYEYPIFSWSYGIELRDLFGMPMDYVQSEVKRRISEALTQDDRVNSVDGYEFTRSKGNLIATFTVHTIYGDLAASREVIA